MINLDALRQAGFFKDHSHLSNDELLEMIHQQRKQLYSQMFGYEYEPEKLKDDHSLAVRDTTKMLSLDTEADVGIENNKYVELLLLCNTVSGTDTNIITDIEELWESPAGPIHVTYKINGATRSYEPEYADDWIDIKFLEHVLGEISAVTQEPFQLCLGPNEEWIGQDVNYIRLKPQERKVLEEGLHWRFLFLLLSFAITFLACSQPRPQNLDSLLTAYHDTAGFNGSVLVARKGAIILEKGYGFKNIRARITNDSNTIFQIGSITKQFTSAIILQLQEQKKLSVHDYLSKFLPDFPGSNKITIEQLLTHTSGVYNYTNDRVFMNTRSTQPISRDSLLALFSNKPPDFQPGQKFSYSNSNYILLGCVIEKVTGTSYFKVVRDSIFRPLHMDHSGFDYTDLRSPDKALGYSSPSADTAAIIVDSSVSFAAGAIYTTVQDLYRWNNALLSDKVISRASLEQAFTPHLEKYGYGWMIDSVEGKRALYHGGGIPGFVALIYRIPADSTCIIALLNAPPGFRGGWPTFVRQIREVLDGNKSY
jgi:CubicO group peptidase (beta-lactamase class C family)